ncbi:hypothetical protein Taro_015489 [Colocasia esculenta]|uniref:Protein phosphatase n=1 Tax=Colocasia esculenta TaxID=4460 RepID=A0A843ULD8_COLES|nr:hypothetical protein [Colocasia esculenta]
MTVKGTSTACIAVIDGQLLCAINIGDRGFLLVRGDKWTRVTHQHALAGSSSIIVASTDGLFDSLFDEEILDLLVEAKVDGHEVPPRTWLMLGFVF